ncbi:adenosylcobyric acid synthase (glutamine-hydrolysing) [Trichodesmium erythraeum IMS101]|uniref:Cobyric acid synthase n=1 Tax=Trichodesmium erythraeum (strain IMS101) TaxID=203124 RepID=COBQ_TRIEI|nr:RecName: Full=Cobyric acid synthase [Trichodesmium erythraeum IMS101]MBS9771111.1 cobyric acid synthase CobQ [Trichodesmium erythraeum GBRTRLIN201]
MKAIMVVGTTSHAGKSLITTAICRILSRRGWKVTPFKGQNMALNSYVTSTGGEMGHAQAVQAWAAGVTPAIEMNPILLKPQGDMTSQVIIKGKASGTVGAVDYYQQYFDIGWNAIQESLETLSQEFNMIVCEGAGSPAEINLKHRDLTNMRVAKHLNASTILVVDIDRGGAFAHIIGTLELLEPEERNLIKGIVINKFRGQRSLLDSGIHWLEKKTNIPVIGVIPWINEAFPAEDSLSILEQRYNKHTTDITIAIIRLPRISNFTDFEPLEAESSVKIKYIHPNDSLGDPDAIIIPGTKTTINDLLVLQKSGMAEAIKSYQSSGGIVMGICGGFQMLGEVLIDSQGLEGKQGEYKGLELLPLITTITPKKIASQRQVIANYPLGNLPVIGYEIHQGRTIVTKPDIVKPLFNDYDLGFVDSYDSIWGNYLHGIFDNGSWRRSWLNILRHKRGLNSLPTSISNYREQREIILDSIADKVNEHLDLKPVLT